jgi:hypothetical protein
MYQIERVDSVITVQLADNVCYGALSAINRFETMMPGQIPVIAAKK